MKKSSLLLSNPYLKDPAVRNALLRQTVISSSAIDGVNKRVASQALDIPSDPTTLSGFSLLIARPLVAEKLVVPSREERHKR